MKKISLFLLLVSVGIFAGCHKDGSNPMKYTFNGLADVTVRQYMDTMIVLPGSIIYTSGPQETLTLTPTNLPAGVTVSPASISGTPGFVAAFTFHVNVTNAGTLPITISATSASSGTKTFTFNIISTANPDCTADLDGYYNAYDSSASGITGPSYRHISSDSTNRFYIDFDNSSDVLLAHMTCGAGTIVTDSSSYYHLSPGTGTFISGSLGTGDTVVIRYKRTVGSTVTYVKSTYTK